MQHGQHLCGEGGVQHGLAHRHLFNGADQSFAEHVFQQIPLRTGKNGCHCGFLIDIGGEKQHLAGRSDFTDFPADLDPIDIGQAQIQQHDSGCQSANSLHRFPPGAHLADNGNPAGSLKERLKAEPDHLMVINNEDRNRLC